MADENRPNTRGRVDNQKDLDTYFKSEAFATLIKKSITEEFERFLSSEGFKDKLVSTTKSVVSEVVSGTVEAIIGNEVDKATKSLQFKIEYLEAQLAMIKSHANDNEQYSRRCNLRFHYIPEQKGENCLLVVIYTAILFGITTVSNVIVIMQILSRQIQIYLSRVLNMLKIQE